MVSTMVQYVVVWVGKTLAWHPIQLLWHGGVLCPEWWEEEEEGREGGRHPPRHGQRRTRRLMCWDIAIKRSSFTTCTMYVHIYATYEAREKVCLNLASYGMSSGISCTPKIQEGSIACFRRPCV